MAVALVAPLATACVCFDYNKDEHQICHYLKDEGFSRSERKMIIQEMNDSGGSLNGNFDSIIGKPVGTIQLNQIGKVGISQENKKFLINFSSLSIFGYVIYAFLKKYCLLSQFL